MAAVRLLPLLLVLSCVSPVCSACGPTEEGQTTTLTCTVDTVDCRSVVLSWQAASVSASPFVIRCTQSACGGGYINNFPTTISSTSSTLTINSVSRTSPFNMETEWTCRGLCNSQTKTVCDKLVVYAKPENPSCTMREDTQSGDITSVTVTCSTTKVYPKAKCSFERIKDGGNPVTISQTPTYTHPPTAGTSAVYYMSECSVTVPVSNLGEGTHSFQGYIYPNVTGGKNLVDVTTASGTVTLALPQASHTCSPQMTGGYFNGKSANCTCSLQSGQSGYPTGRAQWSRLNQMVSGLSDGVLPLSFDSNNPEQVYTCKGVSDIGQGQESTVTAKFAFFDQTSVDVQPSTPSVDLCGNTNNPVTVTCRVSDENVYPAPTFSFSLDGLVFDTPQVGSLNNEYYQHLFSLSPDDGGVYNVTCRVTNTVSGDTQQKETSVTYRVPPTSPPQITIKDQIYQGTNPPNTVTLAAGYTGDVTCRVEGGYPGATITRLTCGSLEGSVTDSAATLTFQTDSLTKDIDGSVCTCTGQHVSGCYSNKETTVTLDVTYAPVVTFTLDTASQVFSERSTPTFTCSANGNPPPSVSLVRQRTQQLLARGQKNSKTTELTHTMEPLGCLDTDVYVCTGQNSRGTIKEEISVRVNCSQQKNSTEDIVVKGSVNGIAQLSLEIYGYPEPTVITLVRTTDKTNLTGSSRHAVRYSPSVPPFGSVDVTISDLAMEDFTNYTITVDNGVEKALGIDFYLQLSDGSDGNQVAIGVGVGVAVVLLLIVVLVFVALRMRSGGVFPPWKKLKKPAPNLDDRRLSADVTVVDNSSLYGTSAAGVPADQDPANPDEGRTNSAMVKNQYRNYTEYTTTITSATAAPPNMCTDQRAADPDEVIIDNPVYGSSSAIKKTEANPYEDINAGGKPVANGRPVTAPKPPKPKAGSSLKAKNKKKSSAGPQATFTVEPSGSSEEPYAVVSLSNKGNRAPQPPTQWDEDEDFDPDPANKPEVPEKQFDPEYPYDHNDTHDAHEGDRLEQPYGNFSSLQQENGKRHISNHTNLGFDDEEGENVYANADVSSDAPPQTAGDGRNVADLDNDGEPSFGSGSIDNNNSDRKTDRAGHGVWSQGEGDGANAAAGGLESGRFRSREGLVYSTLDFDAPSRNSGSGGGGGGSNVRASWRVRGDTERTNYASIQV